VWGEFLDRLMTIACPVIRDLPRPVRPEFERARETRSACRASCSTSDDPDKVEQAARDVTSPCHHSNTRRRRPVVLRRLGIALQGRWGDKWQRKR